MAGTAVCGSMTTNIGRLVSGRENIAIGATAKGVDTEVGDVDPLGREGGPLRIN